jgi:hypothetical protein
VRLWKNKDGEPDGQGSCRPLDGELRDLKSRSWIGGADGETVRWYRWMSRCRDPEKSTEGW